VIALTFNLPPIQSAADAASATAELLAAASRGELSLGEAESLVRVVEAYAKLLVVQDFEQRLTRLEEAKAK
jgi:hypothetical protein